MFDLSEKKALVTGSSRGIGRALALGLARQSADVAVHYVGSKTAAQGVAQEITELGRASTVVQADLGSPTCADDLFDQLADFGSIDILVFNASMDQRMAWEGISGPECDRQLACNLRSTLLLAQKAVPHMKEKGWGRLVAIGSVQERKPHPLLLVYSSAKVAQTHMMQSLALQLAQFGITANSIAPGIIHTDRTARLLQEEAYHNLSLNKIPLGRFGSPEDCVGALILLCSQAGAYITGQNIYVDGGMGIQ